MNKRFLYIAFLLGVMVSCNKTYTGLEDTDMSGDDIIQEEGGEDPVIVETEYKTVSIAIDDPSYRTLTTAKTRAFGAIDYQRDDQYRYDFWNNARFILYGFKDEEGVDYATRRAQNPEVCLLDGEPAYLPDTVGYILQYVMDETHDGNNWWPEDEATEKEAVKTIVPYNFWGYYIDDAVLNGEIRNSDGISIDYTIDGSQDVLAGVAKIDDRQLPLTEADPDVYYWYYYQLAHKRFEERRYDYCTLAARHDVIPTLRLIHQMARFKFEVYPGDATVDPTVIDSFKVEVPVHAVTKLASITKSEPVTTWDPDNKAWLSLHDTDNHPTLHENAYTLEGLWQEGDEDRNLYDRNHIRLGESLMLPPLDEGGLYYVRIWTRFADISSDAGAPTMIKAPKGGFRPGCQYTVRMGIFSPARIEVSVELTGFAPGADIYIDYEDEGFIK